MLSVTNKPIITLWVIMLNVVILSVIMLNVNVSFDWLVFFKMFDQKSVHLQVR